MSNGHSMGSMERKNLKYIAAPMVNQSDLPFRLLVERYGATATFTQMLIPDKLLHDQDYLEFHLRDLQTFGLSPSRSKPVVIQLCGNDPDTVVQAGRKVQAYCDAIGMVRSRFQLSTNVSHGINRCQVA